MKGWAIAVALAFMGFLVASNKSALAQSEKKDTVPKKTEKKIVDLDDALNELDDAHLEVERSLKNIDWKKMETEIQESMKKMEIDLSKMKIELEKSMKEIDVSKVKADIDASLARIDWNKMEKEMEKVKEVDFEKIKTDLAKIQPEIEKSMKQAQESIEKAKAELKEYKAFVDDLEKDGLIDKKGSYTIEHKNNQLIINGRVQPEAVYNKYRSFLEKHGKITIEKSPDNFNIDKD
jgi:hypothetical protein